MSAQMFNPAGRVYRNRKTRMPWTVELEIGGVAWLKSDEGQVIKARIDELHRNLWERIA